MNNHTLFKVFCLENYKNRRKISGKEAKNIFEKYKIFQFLDQHYEPLHSQDGDFVIDCVEERIENFT